MQGGSAESPCLQPLKHVRALVHSWDNFCELATKHWKAPKQLFIVLLTEENHPALCLPQRHGMEWLHKDEEGLRHTWH